MGTFHFQAGLATRHLPEVRRYLAAVSVNAPVLDLGEALLLFPCGSKVGWPNDQQHRHLLSCLETLGARRVTVYAEGEATRDEDTGEGAWLTVTTFDDPDLPEAAPGEVRVALPCGGFVLGLQLHETRPEATYTAIRLPAGVTLGGARWSGQFGQQELTWD